MGDFERTFGAGADAVGIIESFSRQEQDASRATGRGGVSSKRPNYIEDDVEFDPEGTPVHRYVVFSSYDSVARWDAKNRSLAFIRQRGDDETFVMTMVGRRPTT